MVLTKTMLLIIWKNNGKYIPLSPNDTLAIIVCHKLEIFQTCIRVHEHIPNASQHQHVHKATHCSSICTIL